MKIATKQEIKDCISYGVIGLLAIYDYFHIDENSHSLFCLIVLSIVCVFVLLKKQIRACSIYKCIITKDIIPENENAWNSKYPNYLTKWDGIVTRLFREFSLPFPPYQGLAVSGLDKIESVEWDVPRLLRRADGRDA